MDAGRAHAVPGVRPARSSTRPAAATRSAPHCSTASNAAGRSRAAPNSATASVRSRSPAAAARIMCWIARRWRCSRQPGSSSPARGRKPAHHGRGFIGSPSCLQRPLRPRPAAWAAAGGTAASSARPRSGSKSPTRRGSSRTSRRCRRASRSRACSRRWRHSRPRCPRRRPSAAASGPRRCALPRPPRSRSAPSRCRCHERLRRHPADGVTIARAPAGTRCGSGVALVRQPAQVATGFRRFPLIRFLQ